MITIEQVEYLRGKANISYDEAKTLLEKHNGDMVEAITELEKMGKIDKKCCHDKSFKKTCKNIFRKGNENRLVVLRGDDTIINLSFNFTIITFFIATHLVIIALLISLISGYKIRFKKEKKSVHEYSSVKEFVNEAKKNVKTTVDNLVKE